MFNLIPELATADSEVFWSNGCFTNMLDCGAERFDLLMLHNPDRTGYRSEAVWEGMRAVRDAGLTRLLGVAPGTTFQMTGNGQVWPLPGSPPSR